MAANDRLVIFRGDDTGGTLGRRLSFVITATEGVSLDGCRAEWIFDGIVKEFAAPLVSGEEREIFYSHNETRCMKPGVRFGTFRIIDAAGKVRTVDNTRPVEVTDSVARCYPGSSSATVFVGTVVSWDQVSGKPPLVKTINGNAPDESGNINVDSGGTVKSATVNGGEKVVPTADGNLAIVVDVTPADYPTVRSNAATGAAHAANPNPHVTSSQKETWDAKQDQLTEDQLTNIAAVPVKRDMTDLAVYGYTPWRAVFTGPRMPPEDFEREVVRQGLPDWEPHEEDGEEVGGWFVPDFEYQGVMYYTTNVGWVDDREGELELIEGGFTTQDGSIEYPCRFVREAGSATSDRLAKKSEVTAMAEGAVKAKLPYSLNSTGLKDRAFNSMSFDGTEFNLSTALAEVTPTAEGQPRDLLIVATATAATTISYTAGTIKGDKPTIYGVGTWLITLTEYAANTWYCRQIKMEDAA